MHLLPMASSPDGLISARDAVITKTPGWEVLTTTSNWGGGVASKSEETPPPPPPPWTPPPPVVSIPVQVQALAAALHVRVRVEYLDRAAVPWSPRCGPHRFVVCGPAASDSSGAAGGGRPRLAACLLFRPGHYDLLVPRDEAALDGAGEPSAAFVPPLPPGPPAPGAARCGVCYGRHALCWLCGEGFCPAPGCECFGGGGGAAGGAGGGAGVPVRYAAPEAFRAGAEGPRELDVCLGCAGGLPRAAAGAKGGAFALLRCACPRLDFPGPMAEHQRGCRAFQRAVGGGAAAALVAAAAAARARPAAARGGDVPRRPGPAGVATPELDDEEWAVQQLRDMGITVDARARSVLRHVGCEVNLAVALLLDDGRPDGGGGARGPPPAVAGAGPRGAAPEERGGAGAGPAAPDRWGAHRLAAPLRDVPAADPTAVGPTGVARAMPVAPADRARAVPRSALGEEYPYAYRHEPRLLSSSYHEQSSLSPSSGPSHFGWRPGSPSVGLPHYERSLASPSSGPPRYGTASPAYGGTPGVAVRPSYPPYGTYGSGLPGSGGLGHTRP